MTSAPISPPLSCSPCLACGKTAHRVWVEYPGYVRPDVFDIYRCPQCNTSFALPMESKAPVYEWIYHNMRQLNGYSEYLRLAKEIRFRRNPLRTLTKWSSTYWGVAKAIEHLPPSREVKILEVGSGLGYLTYALCKTGYDAVGLDISRRAVDDARRRFGVHYVCDDLLAFAAEHVQKFDAVIMTELLEHVPDIFGLLLAAKSCLREAGKIIITTPNIESLPPGALWISDAPPVHLWCFSPASFLAIGARIDCRVNFIDLRPSGLDLPLESFLALDHTKPQRSPSFDSQGHVLLRRSFPDRIRTLLDDMLADAGILRVTRCAKTRLRSRFARRRFGSTPTGLCAQLSP